MVFYSTYQIACEAAQVEGKNGGFLSTSRSSQLLRMAHLSGRRGEYSDFNGSFAKIAAIAVFAIFAAICANLANLAICTDMCIVKTANCGKL
jgi:hypothetical protein